MNFLFASDSFKGSLSSVEISRILSRAAQEVFPGCSCRSVPMADGGEGTAQAVIASCGGKWIPHTVQDPIGRPVSSGFGLLSEGRCIIEMASASGLALLEDALRDPRKTSTFGTGQLIAEALEEGCRDISVAIGGSATNDGGMGCMRALGVKFTDAAGRVLEGRGEDLGRVARADASGIMPQAKQARFTVMCDVDNPLLGPDGATFTFGPQKGADAEIARELEAGMSSYACVLKEQLGADTDFPGAGGAGGLGAALAVFLGAEIKSGAETVLDLAGFDAMLEGVDMVITGEGRIDWQSARGKAVSAVARHCRAADVPCIAIVGGMGERAEEMLELLDSIATTAQGPCTLEFAMRNARELYESAALRTFRLLRAGHG